MFFKLSKYAIILVKKKQKRQLLINI